MHRSRRRRLAIESLESRSLCAVDTLRFAAAELSPAFSPHATQPAFTVDDDLKSTSSPTKVATTSDSSLVDAAYADLVFGDVAFDTSAEGEATCDIRLSGQLPRHLVVTNSKTGIVAFEGDSNSLYVDMCSLPNGSYVVRHTGPSDRQRALGFAVNNGAVTQFDTSLTFQGATPRRVVITDQSTGQISWDAWIYQNTIDVVGLFPDGTYGIRDAASGEHWRSGVLEIGNGLPSHRLLAENHDDGNWTIDWGELGTFTGLHLLVDDGISILVDGDYSTTSANITTDSEYLHLVLTLPDGSRVTFETGERPMSPFDLSLDGEFPQNISLLDVTTGAAAVETEVSANPFDVHGIATGAYIMKRTVGSTLLSSASVVIDDNRASMVAVPITLDGDKPRRVEFVDASSSTFEPAWDGWIYYDKLDVVSILEPGRYHVQDAASGENWRPGELLVGAAIPSYRIFIRRTASGDGWLVDWGTLGNAASAHVTVTDGTETLTDTDYSTTETVVSTSSEYIKVDVTISGYVTQTIEFGTAPTPPYHLALTGQFPELATIVDTATRQTVWSGTLTTSDFDAEFLTPGDFLLLRTHADGTRESSAIAIDNQHAWMGDTHIHLPGNFPQRVQIEDTGTNILWDYWVYGDDLDAIGLFPNGTYTIRRAEPSQNWIEGTITIGDLIPSFRTFTEPQPDGQLRFDAGTLGTNEGNRIRFYSDETVVGQHDLRTAGAETIPIPPTENGFTIERIHKYHIITLDDALPQHVELIDTTDGSMVAEWNTSEPSIDLTETPPGDYLLRHYQIGATYKPALQLTLTADRTDVQSTAIPIEGSLPQRVRIMDAATENVLLDFWHYANSLDVVSFLPTGDYLIEHAASGENFVRGYFRVGTNVPSYRTLVEAKPNDVLSIDWGSLGTLDNMDYAVRFEGVTVEDSSSTSSSTSVTVPRGFVEVEVDRPGTTPSFVIDFCSLEVLAADNTCRQFDHTDFAYLASTTNFGIRLSSNFENPSTQFEILDSPNHGTLVAGLTSQFQTYVPLAGFTGFDSFTYRVTSTGHVETGLAAITVLPPADPSRGYFVPGVGTVNVEYATPEVSAPSTLTLLPNAMLVNSQFGQVIDEIERDGTVGWRHTPPLPGRAIDVYGIRAYYTTYNDIRVLDVADGKLLTAITPNLGEAGILQFVNALNDTEFLVSWDDVNGASKIAIFDSAGDKTWQAPSTFSYPRWAEIQDGVLVVADTFSHRVVGMAMLGGAVVFDLPAYYPNDVRFVGATSLLITEEHSDRIWTYDWLIDSRTLLIKGAGDRGDLRKNLSEIIDESESPALRIDASSTTSKSKSSYDFNGVKTVYAPNGAVLLHDGTYYVADSDNHRVIHLSETGDVLDEFRGFNSPTKIAIIP